MLNENDMNDNKKSESSTNDESKHHVLVPTITNTTADNDNDLANNNNDGSKGKRVKFSESVNIPTVRSTVSFYSDSDDDEAEKAKNKLNDYETEDPSETKPLLTTFKDKKKKLATISENTKSQSNNINNYLSINNNEANIDQISPASASPRTRCMFLNDGQSVNESLFINSITFAEDLASKTNDDDDDFLSNKFESLDYERIYNIIDLNIESKTKPSKFVTRKEVSRWFVMLLVGILTGLLAVFVDFYVDKISNIKYSFVAQKMQECASNGCLFRPLLYWIGSNVGLSLVACILVVFLAPAAAGSGIPMVKCYLNGVKVPKIVRFKTLIAKAVGVVFAVCGGLACGKEGPMIHSGAIIAAGISQGFSSSLGFDLNIFRYFRSDTEKRDFVSGGAAAGVTAAFGAPVGGVLFALEEGASFWNQQLTWRIFFGSMVCTFTLNIFLSLIHGKFGDLSNPGLINFGKFQNVSYQWYELAIFLLMGAFGGLVGALFNHINTKLIKFRSIYIKHKISSLMECMIVASMSAIIGFLLSFYFRYDCQPIGRDLVSKYPVQLFCDDGQYNAMSGLFFQTPEKSVKSLFHDPPGSFNPVTLTVFCIAYYILAVWTYGLAIPSGLFIPTLLIGAAWGRLFGIGLNKLMPSASVDIGKYALVGAASSLGGILRMTLSLTVILTEATGDISLGLPIMFSIMAAKIVGDFFNEGIFDMHVELSGVPLLDWDPPAMTKELSAQHVMAHPVIVLRERETVSRIMHVLKTTQHNGFPVVSGYDPSDHMNDSFGQLKGLILRHQLLTLIKKKSYLYDSPELTPDDFLESYPRFIDLNTIEVNESDYEFEIDLRPYMNLAPYTLTENSNLPRMFRLFRGLGLRHLVIVNETNNVVGMVTRIDLAKYKSHVGFLHASIRELTIVT